MEILIALLVLCALVLMVHAWRASLIVLGLVAVLFAWGSTLPPSVSVARESTLYDSFCRSMAYGTRRTAYLVVMGEAKRQEVARMSPSERQSMWRLIGARVGCEF